MSQDPYDGDSYGDTRGVRDEETDDAFDDTPLPSGGSMFPFEWSIWSSDADDNVVYEDESVERAEYDEAYGDEDDGSWWDEGLIGTVLLAGLVLFLFPEPATSAVGIFLLALGAVAWAVDWLL